MNLFVLDENPIESAKHYCDIHVNKIILEAAGCMCAAHWEHDFPKIEESPLPLRIGQYRSRTHHNNHVTMWVRQTTSNYKWTALHAIALCDEYSRRYRIRAGTDRRHASEPIVHWLASNIPSGVPENTRTQFRLATTPECYSPDIVASYWVYYVVFKRHLTTWKWTTTPWWYRTLNDLFLNGTSINNLLESAIALRRKLLPAV
jgi:hypothetical protein